MLEQTNVALGFGTMRLPLLDASDQTSFDYQAIQQLFDAQIEQGSKYFVTT